MLNKHTLCLVAFAPILVACGSPRTAATQSASVQKWAGTGELFTTEGQAVGSYGVELERHPLGDGAWEHRITVSRPGATPMKLTQRYEGGERNFRVTSDDSEGGGMDLGDGLVTSYVVDADGLAHASTIVLDGEDGMRILRYELRNGKAERIYKEVYARK